MQEWSKKNRYNSFNSWKGLLYGRWYMKIRQKTFLPPVEASLDPIHQCNLSCEHCNAHRYLKTDKNTRMPDKHLLHLIGFLKNWGVKAVCFGGGGEPSMHTYLSKAIHHARKVGLYTAVATNGVVINEELINAYARCRWVGISVDAATAETYLKGKKHDCFQQVLINISELVKTVRDERSDCDIAYKFLIMPYNQHEIYQACKLAKGLGVRDFHARPADYSHQGMGEIKKKTNEFDIPLILEQFEKCQELETDKFRVFTVMHKFDETLRPQKDFTQCYAAPICIQLCADGNVYLCPDQRHNDFYKLGTHYPNPENILNFWGKERHQELVFKQGASQCNTRCTFAPYNKQCEELYIKNADPMCWRFV